MASTTHPSMRHELEQRRDGMWTGAYVTLLLVVPAAYSTVLVDGLALRALVVAAAMGLALAGYALATSARRIEAILRETLPRPTLPRPTLARPRRGLPTRPSLAPPAEVDRNP